MECSLSLFIWLGRISILLPFTSIKTACQAAGFYDGMTFSTCRKPTPFLAFRGGERVKLLLMKNKASNSTGDITMNQKIRVVVFFFLTMQNEIRIKLSLTLSYLLVYDGAYEIASINSRAPSSVPPGCSDPSWDHVGSTFGARPTAAS